jgi:Ca2+-binding RTX toxin-like protein
MTVQSVQFDPRVSSSQANETVAYWDNPAEQDALAQGTPPLSTGTTVPVDPARRSATGDEVTIDGGDAGTRLSDGSTPDGKTIERSQLHEGEQATVTREQTIADAGFGQTYVSSDQVVFTTNGTDNDGTGSDDVQVRQRDDGTLEVGVNGETYAVRLAEGQELTVRTGGGNDVINVAPNVSVNLVVDGGVGDDTITTGAGDDRIDAGEGNDTVDAGEGRNDVFGNSGNDVIRGGNGANIFYGGDGDDEITGGTGSNYLEGGAGADTIAGGGSTDMLSGGVDDDRIIAGTGRSSIYAGAGTDTIEGAGNDATVYAETGDTVNSATGAKPTVVNVEIDSSLGSSVTVEGSPAFRQRMQAELDFLRSSPNGQRMLAEFDKAAEAKGNSVTIRELANEQNGYAQTFSNDADIVNGRPGAGGDVTISYNPSFHMDAFPAPVAVLYHEMSHAYNGVNGTFQTGTYQGEGPDSGNVPNAERQAVGLETSAPAFDFDGDAATPATTHNPTHLTENGIRRELGLPDRPSYTIEF